MEEDSLSQSEITFDSSQDGKRPTTPRVFKDQTKRHTSFNISRIVSRKMDDGNEFEGNKTSKVNAAQVDQGVEWVNENAKLTRQNGLLEQEIEQLRSENQRLSQQLRGVGSGAGKMKLGVISGTNKIPATVEGVSLATVSELTGHQVAAQAISAGINVLPKDVIMMSSGSEKANKLKLSIMLAVKGSVQQRQILTDKANNTLGTMKSKSAFASSAYSSGKVPMLKTNKKRKTEEEEEVIEDSDPDNDDMSIEDFKARRAEGNAGLLLLKDGNTEVSDQNVIISEEEANLALIHQVREENNQLVLVDNNADSMTEVKSPSQNKGNSESEADINERISSFTNLAQSPDKSL